MRKAIMVGNWKMNKTIAEAKELAGALKASVGDVTAAEVVLCPPFTALAAVADAVRGSNIGVGAQDMCAVEEGAVTGAVSPKMVQEVAQYVILGHSERREYFGESDKGVNKKAKRALEYNLTPIICCGENLAQNEAGETAEFVSGQIRGALAGLSADDAKKVVIAYEPIWAIGTGKTAEPTAVNSLIGLNIRGVIADMFDEETAQSIRILYGGSMKPANVESFMVQPEIDGGLVGGASLKADAFTELVRVAAK